jgi:hypothetical protein
VIWKRKAFRGTIHANGVKITPQSETIGIDFPLGGLVWNRPVAVFVEQEGETRRIPIVDITRMTVLLLWGLTFVFSVFQIAASRQMRVTSNE